MATTTGTFILQRLSKEWGVDRIYGYSGDGINGVIGGWHHVDGVEFIQVRHEEIAAFAACAHAKLTGEVGVCLATSGPGAIHLLNGLYDAKLDHQPVVAIIGQQARLSIGADYQQEVDLQSLFKDVAGAFVQTCMVPGQAPLLIDRAMRIAKATRSPTAVIIPNDVQALPYEAPPYAHGAVTPSSASIRRPVVVPDARSLQEAADVLNAGKRVALLVGAGAKHAVSQVEAVADALGAGAAKALNGRAVLPDDLPWVTGAIGLLGTKPSYDLMQDCDTLLMIGSSFPYAEWLPEPGSARGVQIDIDARKIGIRYPTEVNLVGDAAQTLDALLPLLHAEPDPAWRTTIAKGVDAWWQVLDRQAHTSAKPVNPQLVLHELSAHLPDDCIMTVDTGSITDWWARHTRVRRGMDAILSGTLASMGPGLPYALAAKFAYPDRPVVAVVGDGGMQMLGINALMDLARYAERWTNRQLVVCVLNNHDLNQVTWEQRVTEGDPKLDASQNLPDVDISGLARTLGLHGVRVERPDDVGPAFADALAAGGPAVVEVVTDPEVPPLPPHISFEQAASIAKAVAKGEPATRDIMRNTLKSKLTELLSR